MNDPTAKILTVPKLPQALRLDKFLIEQFPWTSRNYWKQHLADLKLNGKTPQKGAMLFGNEVLIFSFWPQNKKTPLLANSKIKLSILYEDDFILAVDKPWGIPCLPIKAQENHTVIHGILAQRPKQIEVSPEDSEAGLIHRLDNETSGVLLFAKTTEAKTLLKKLNERGEIKKQYQCWVRGEIRESGKIDFPIAHHPKNKKKMFVVREENKVERFKARPAFTQYESLKTIEGFSLLKAILTKGARHQIRIHMAALGWPIVGDALYDVHSLKSYPRHLLHAWRLNFIHPYSTKELEITAPIPENFLP